MAGETETPNIGLQVPGFNQSNWQVPTNFNWALLDLIFGGEYEVPALKVANFIITNIGMQLAASFVAEVPTGVIPGNSYVLANTPSLILGFFWNGLLQLLGQDYTVTGDTITLTSGATVTDDTLIVLYFK